LRTWVEKSKKGLAFCETSGAPKSVDQVGLLNLQQFITGYGVENGNAHLCPTFKEVDEYTQQVAQDTKRRRGKGYEGTTIDSKTVKKQRPACNMTSEKGQTTTNARVTECGDVRNNFSFFTMCQAFSPMDGNFIYNWDATSFGVTDNNDQLLVKILGVNDDLTATQVASGDTCLFIKLYHFHNAAGDVGPQVFIIADKDMEEGDMEAYEVFGLSSSGGQQRNAWLVFTKTRAGNDKFYKWYLETVINPFVKERRHLNGIKVQPTRLLQLMQCLSS